MKKKCFLYAYDKVNLGDDLFIRELSNRYSKTTIYLWSEKKNRRVFKGSKNVRVLAQDSGILALLKRINPSIFSRYKAYLEKRCDAVVYIGGSIFIQYDNWKKILTWWDFEVRNRSFYVLGANFGPYTSKEYQKSFDEIFLFMKDVCFRDKYSYNLFNSLNTVRYAPDILFNYRFDSLKNKKQIFISIIDLENRNSGTDKISDNEIQYLNLVTNLINYYISLEYDVILSSFCEKERDNSAVEKVATIVDSSHKKRIHCIFYTGCNEDEITKAIGESEIIIASRFHSMILGFAAGKKVLPLIYSDKMLNVLSDLDFRGSYIDIRRLKEHHKIQIESIDWDLQRIDNLDSIKNESKKHFQNLDRILI